MKLLKDLRLNKINNLISLAIFGSYGTKYWRSGSSDIDIFILMAKREDIMDEINLEEIILPILEEHFNYDNIHLTFLNMRDYDSRLARQYLDSEDKLIIDEFKELDFRLYVNKYLRKWLERKIQRDTKMLEDIKRGSFRRKMMTKLYLTRHGETEWNEKGIMQGWGNSPLTELGVKQAEWLRDRMNDLHIDVIYSSPIGRAYDTAKIVKGERDITLKTHDGLKEIRIGGWEGLNQEEMKGLGEDNYYNFWNVPSKYAPTGNGENFYEVKERAFEAVNEILEKEKGKTILIVTHTITLKSYLTALQNRDIDTLWEPPFIKQTSLTEINFTEEGYEMPLVACMEHHEYSRKEFNEFK